MTRQRLTITTPWLWACAIALSGTLANRTLNAADVGYPPPPGAYRSEPSVWSDTPHSPPQEHAGPDDRSARPSAASSRVPPLPDQGFDHRSGSDDAAKLFGAAPAPRQKKPMPTPPEFMQPPQQARADDPAPPAFVPQSYTAQRHTGHNDFSMDFSRESRRAATTRGDPHPEAPALQGYPAHAPSYPGYRQHPGPYPPGRAMPYAVGPATPAYPDYRTGRHVSAYPQPGSTAPPPDQYRETDTVTPQYAAEAFNAPGFIGDHDAAPAAQPPPDTVDSAVFRPTD